MANLRATPPLVPTNPTIELVYDRRRFLRDAWVLGEDGEERVARLLVTTVSRDGNAKSPETVTIVCYGERVKETLAE